MAKETYSLAQFLSGSIDAMPDAPVRALLPEGKHVIQVTEVSQKTLGATESEALVVSCKYIQTLELVNPADAVLKAGEDVDFTFFTNNQGGLGSLKDFLKPIAQPGILLSELLPAMVGQQFIVTTKIRKWKDKNSGEQKQGHESVGGLALLST